MLTIGCGGDKPKNLQMARGNLQVFFLKGGKPKIPQMAGGKSHLTLKLIGPSSFLLVF